MIGTGGMIRDFVVVALVLGVVVGGSIVSLAWWLS